MSRLRTLVALLTAAVMLSVTSACAARPKTATPQLLAGAARTIAEFTPDTLAEYRGRVVLLNFWALWCVPCRSEMPDLEEIYRRYRDRGLVVVAVNVTFPGRSAESAGDVTAYADTLDLTFPILRDSQLHGLRTYGINAIPTSVFFDRSGKNKMKFLGTMSQSVMTKVIEPLLQ